MTDKNDVRPGPVPGTLTINGRVCMKVMENGRWWWITADKGEPELKYPSGWRKEDSETK